MGDKGKPSAAWGENSFARWGADNWQAFSVVDGKEQPLGRPVTPDGEGALLEIPKAPGAGLVLKLFSSQANGAVVASANFDGPWTAARLRLTPDARPEPAGAKESATWLVPVVFVENEAGTKGRRLYFWVLVTLRAPLPVASDWPTPAQLGK